MNARRCPWTGALLLLAPALWIGPSGRAAALELELSGGRDTAHVQLQVEVDGRAVSTVWEETFDRLFAYHDRDGDGTLDAQETRRLPSLFVVRQVLWGQIHPVDLPGPTMEECDEDGDGRVGRPELVRWYQSAGLGDVVVATGTPPASARLTEALFPHLDSNGDRRVDAQEWKAAALTLQTLDRNDDELVGPGELVAGLTYPGAAGTMLLPVRAPGGLAPDERGALALLAPRPAALDREQSGAASECPRWCVRLGVCPTGQPDVAVQTPGDGPLIAGDLLRLDAGRVHLIVRVEEGQLAGRVTAVTNDYQSRFGEADVNRDDCVDEEEAAGRSQARLRPMIAVADRDGNGRLSRTELVDWLGMQAQIARGHVLLSVLDHQTSLFAFLDADGDAALSVRELRAAWDRLCAERCVVDAELDAARLPHLLIATLSQGHPVRPHTVRREGPSWFRAMDRNGDGDLSRREFVGPAPAFQELDADGDGLISGQEAEQYPRLPSAAGKR